MDKSLRRPVIAGNWKMNNNPEQTKALIEAMKPLVADADCDVVICAPYIDLYAAMEAAAGSNFACESAFFCPVAVFGTDHNV